MIDVLYLFYINGILLIQRNYRQNASKSDLSQYISKYLKTKRILENPIIEINDEFYMSIVKNDIVFTVRTRNNCNVCMVFAFLYKLVDILNMFFENDISSQNIINNFVLIYELCDEIVDYGYPQTLDLNILKTCMMNKVKYYSKTSKYIKNLGSEYPQRNRIVEDIINDKEFYGKKSNREVSIYKDIITSNHYERNVGIPVHNNYLPSEKNKLRNIGKEALKKIKNKIKNNNPPINSSVYFITGNCTWRNNNIYYKKNEVYIDILEMLNVTFTNNNIIYAHVNGIVNMKCLLSGMPYCELSISTLHHLNLSNMNKIIGPDFCKDSIHQKNQEEKEKDPVTFDNCIFHQCVLLSKFEKSNIITFTPPDGTFELMKYTITKNVNIPFRINSIYNPIIQYEKSKERKFFFKKFTSSMNHKTEKNYKKSSTRNKNYAYDENGFTNKFEYSVTIKSDFTANVQASDIVLEIPIYKYAGNIEVSYKSGGKTEFNNMENTLYWKIKKFPDTTEHTIKIQLTIENQNSIYSNMNNIQKTNSVFKVIQVHNRNNGNMTQFLNKHKLPITLHFKIPMFLSSGMCIKYLKIVEKSNYKVIKWIKYLTQSNIYQYK